MSIIRNALHSTRVVKRYISSKSHAPEVSISPTKMRALISLYHETEHFVTAENLSDKIDDAFLMSDEAVATAEDSRMTGQKYESIQDLRNRITDRRRVPRLGGNNLEAPVWLAQEEGWSSTEHERARAVADALYGTVKRTKPGLEALEESMDEVQQALMEDRQNSPSSEGS